MCCERAPSPHSQRPDLHGVINALQKPWLVFRPLPCPGASLQPNCPVGIAASEPNQAAKWHQGTQPPCSSSMQTPLLRPLRVSFPAQRQQNKALLQENLKKTQVRNFWEFLRFFYQLQRRVKTVGYKNIIVYAVKQIVIVNR